MADSLDVKAKRVVRKALIALIVSAAGLLCAVAALEVFLRAGGAALLLRHESANRTALSRPDGVRVLSLGDSCTFQHYPKFLPMFYRDSGGRTLEVIDKALPGTGSLFVLANIDEYLEYYHPDVVTVMMGINDSNDPLDYGAVRARAEYALMRWLRTYELFRLLAWQAGREIRHAVERFSCEFLRWRYNYGDARKMADWRGDLQDRLNRADRGLSPQAEDVDGLKREVRHILDTSPPMGIDNIVGVDETVVAGIVRILERRPEVNQSNKVVEQIIRRRIDAAPEDPYFYMVLFMFQKSTRQYDEARRTLDRLFEFFPNDERLLWFEEGFCFDRGDWEGARRAFAKLCTAYTPPNFSFIFHINEVMMPENIAGKRSHEVEKYLWWLAETVSEPKHPLCFTRLVLLYTQQSRYGEALKWLRRIDPRGGLSLERIKAMERMLRRMSHMTGAFLTGAPSLEVYGSPLTQLNYCKLADRLFVRGVPLVCVGYAGQSMGTLRRVLAGRPGVYFVDNEKLFEEAVARDGYTKYFSDNFGGNFGHTTEAGDLLFAENIMHVIEENGLLAAGTAEKDNRSQAPRR